MPTRGFADEVPDAFEGGGVPRADAGEELRPGGRDQMGMRVDGAAVFPAGGFAGFITVAFEIEREVQGRHAHGLGMGRGILEEALEIVSPYVEDDLAGACFVPLFRDEEALHVGAMQAHLQEVRDLRVGRPDQSPLVVGLADHFLGDDLPERLDEGFGRFEEAFGERADEPLLRGGVDDGEGDLLEGAGELNGKGSMEELGDQLSVVTEGAATPRSEDQGVMSLGFSHGEDLEDALHQDVGQLRVVVRKHFLRQGSGRGDERGQVGGGEELVLVVAEDRDVSRVDHGVAVERGPVVAVIFIHRRVFDREEERARAAEVFLLGAGAAEEAAAGLGRRGEVEGDGIVALGEMATMCGEGSLVGDLYGRLVRPTGGGRVRVVGFVVGGLLQRDHDRRGDVHGAGGREVFAGLGDGDGLLSEVYGEVAGDAWIELGHSVVLLGFWYTPVIP